MKKRSIVKACLAGVCLCAACVLASCSIGHVHTVVVDEAEPAACEASGLTAGAHCADCGEILVEQQVVPATDHDIVADPAVNPTCTVAGVTTGSHCAVCGAVIKAQTQIPALGHDPVDDPAIAPTCTTGGVTAGSHCADCGAVIAAQEILPALGHTIVTDPAVEPTSLRNGYTKRVYCSTCGTVFAERETVKYQKTADSDGTAGQNETMSVEDSAVLLLNAVGSLLSREYTDAELAAQKTADLSVMRAKIRTMGDAVAFLDSFGSAFRSGGELTYAPKTCLDMLKQGKSNTSVYSFLVGYLLSDDIPGLQVIQSACNESGAWLYTGLLVPQGESRLIISPSAYSSSYQTSNCYPCAFRLKLIPSLDTADDLMNALHTTGVDEDGTLENVYLFIPDDAIYTFNYDGDDLTCDALEPIAAGTVEKDYDTMIARLITMETSDDKIETEMMTAQTLEKVLALCDEDLDTAADNVNTLAEALALLIFRDYKANGYDIDLADGNLYWHYHKDAETIYNRNWGDCGSSSTLMGYLLRDDYDEVGVISMTYKKGQGGGHVINYVKSDNTYYVFDVVNLVANGYTGANFNFSTGDTLASAYAAFCGKTSSTEIFAFSWKATDRDIPVGWYADDGKWGSVVLPDQYKDQINILYQSGNAKYEYKAITQAVYTQMEDDRQ